MKITNFTLLFLIFFLCIATRIDRKTSMLDQMSQKKVQYDLAVEAAVDDAAVLLVESDSKRKLTLNKEKCVAQFFDVLYAAFGVDQDKNRKEHLKAYVPVILVTAEDGYYIHYSDLYKEAGNTYVTQQWTGKKAYAYEDAWFIYAFTLRDYVRVYNKSMGKMEEGLFKDLSAAHPNQGLFTSYSLFDEVRRKSIVNALTEDMKYYSNRHNRIGQHYGIQYNFALPVISQEDWYRTIDDASLFVVFQGYPYGAGTTEVYNRYAFAGSRIKKSNCYYITEDGIGRRYHKAGCEKVEDVSDPYYTKKECAQEGAWPCTICSP